MKIGIVIPTYNERENIERLLPRIFKIAEENNLDVRVLVVDDNSPDGTADAVKNLMKKFPIEIIQRESKLGIGSAYIDGFKEILKNDVDIIIQMDADLSHDPNDILRFVEKINSSCDIVIGSRNVPRGRVEGWKFGRKLISFGGNWVGRVIAGLGVKDLTSGYRAYRKQALQKINWDGMESGGDSFKLELLYKIMKKGFKVVEIPIVFKNREIGKSKLSKRDIIDFLILTLKIRFKLI